jgi:hypothetical protein
MVKSWVWWLLEMPFPDSDQRNTRESLSKAKREVLLLQKAIATDHSLIGRTHWVGISSVFISLSLTLMDGLSSQSLRLVT